MPRVRPTMKMDEKKKKKVPPFASGELPLHESGELGFGDVGFRVPFVKEERKLLCVEVVESDQIKGLFFLYR